jgi:diguanylate cyclase (GGDEF)-like protein/PAS domain S-box-containing protein
MARVCALGGVLHGPPLRGVGVAGAVIVVLLCMLAVTILHQQADRRRQAEAVLAHIEAATHQLVLAHELSKHQFDRDEELLSSSDALDARLVSSLADLASLDPGSGRAAQVRVAVHAYRGASRQLFELVRREDQTGARAWETLVEAPSRQRLMDILADATAQYKAEAEQANNLSDTGTLVVVAMAGLLAGTLFWRSQIAERRTLEASEERFRSLVQNSADLLAILAEDGHVRYISPSVQRLTGYSPQQIVGTSILALVHPADVHLVARLLADVTHGSHGSDFRAFRVRRSDGSWVHLEAICTDQRDAASVEGLVLNARDVSERTALEEQLTHRAFHDPLTELPNRALLVDRLTHALARASHAQTSVGVVFIDLDDFKAVNDSLGHHVGDQLLVGVANRLRASIRAGDMPARLGGDEFIVLLEHIADASDANVVAARFAEELRPSFSLGGRDLRIGASIGVAIARETGMSAEDLLRHADLAMYAAKARGTRQVVTYDAALDDQPLERLELEADLHGALDRQELRLHYQPIVELATGRFRGLEALIRWDHPTRGLVQPSQFIPLAEQTGLIVPIGRWVLREACRQNKTWSDSLPECNLAVSVNLSARQFQHPGLVSDVAAALRESGLSPSRLKLEITESVAMEAGLGTIQTLEALKSLGIHLAIDDFGTGYSSLAYLKRFPVDTLKIDRVFVDGLGTDAQDTAIVRSVIALAQALDLSVVAEGIESGQQLDALRALNCDEGQGYCFAKPQPAQQITELLKRQDVARRQSEAETARAA